MPVPRNKNQITPWLKQHGYQWVLKSPGGAIVTLPEAIKQIQETGQQEQHKHEKMGDDYFVISEIYPSEAAMDTEHVWGEERSEDTYESSFHMDAYTQREEIGGVIRYTFADDVVLIQHDGMLDTESEYKDEIQAQKLKS